MLDLVTAGEAFDDFIFDRLPRMPGPGEEIKTSRFSRSPGGGAVITAIAASRLGFRCRIISGVSREAARMLRAERVRLTNLRRTGEPPAITIALSTPRDRAFVTFNGVNDRLPERLRAALDGVRARHVHFAFCPAPCRPWVAVVDRLRGAGIATSWDFGWNPQLRRDSRFAALAEAVDYLFLNRDEARMYAPAATTARAVRRWRRAANCVVIKLGVSGSRAVGRGIDARAAAIRTRAIDTTGAGDAFNAGFIVARLRGANLARALAVGNRIGAASTRRPGGIAGLPKRGTTPLFAP